MDKVDCPKRRQYCKKLYKVSINDYRVEVGRLRAASTLDLNFTNAQGCMMFADSAQVVSNHQQLPQMLQVFQVTSLC